MALKSVCVGLLGLRALASADVPIPLDQLGAVAQQQYQGDGLAVSATPEGAQLRCVFQRLTGRVTPEGLSLESTEPGGGQLHLRATAIHREAGQWSADIPVGFNLLPDEVTFTATDAWPSQAGWKPALPRTGSVSVQDGRVQFRRPGLVEEYSVSMDGVRQDFIIETPPASERRFAIGFPRGDDPKPATDGRSGQFGEWEEINAPDRRSALRVELELTGARAEALANGVRLTLAGSGRELAYSRLRVTDATGRELPARFDVAASRQSAAVVVEREDGGGLPTRRYARLAVLVDDSEAVYPVRIDPTFSDADWVSLSHGLPGGNSSVLAFTTDEDGHVYVAGKFTFIGTVAASIAKWDGSSWSSIGTGVRHEPYSAYTSVSALAVSGTNLYVGGTFTKIGGLAATNIAKWNGTAWSALGPGLDSSVNALALSGNTLYAGGTFTYAGGVRVNGIARWNGSSWSALSSGMGRSTYIDVAVHALALSGNDLYAGGSFLTAGGIEVRNIAKWDGSSWSPLGSGTTVSGSSSSSPDPYGPVYALALSGTNLYAGGNFATAGGVAARRIAKWDGSAWSALGSGMSGPPDYYGLVYALTMSGDNLYAAGSFTNAGGVAATNIAKWDGSSWSPLGLGINGEVRALAVSGVDLYAGGSFGTAGGVTADGIAKWDGSNWAALGVGISYTGGPDYYTTPVNALAVSGTNLYVGGSFSSVPGIKANRIAQWNGSAWSALGSGLNARVSALAVSGTNLYAGGRFTTAGGITANRIAKWDGSTWSALGAGVNNDVYALVTIGNHLYAGGTFTTAGGVAANRIARWNGSSWSALGSGMSGGVYALAVMGTDLYAGGMFTTGGSLPANLIAKWNGSSWSALGEGISGGYGAVEALAVYGMDLYAGGDFTRAGGLPASMIAKWNGSTWSALGPGMTHKVRALAVSGTNLYAGGEFTAAGAVFANNIAKWDGNSWTALGSGVTCSPPSFIDWYITFVNALAADEAGHLFVGGHFWFAGDKVSPFIAQANLTPQPMVIEGIRVDAGVVTLDCRGAAGVACTVQRATDVRFTQDLTTLHTTNAPPTGRFTCTDATPPATTAFYRLYQL